VGTWLNHVGRNAMIAQATAIIETKMIESRLV